MRALAWMMWMMWIVCTLVGCRPRLQQTPAPEVAAPDVAAPGIAKTSCRVAPTPPPDGPGAVGPAYVLVDGVGLLRISGDEVTTVLEMPDSASSVRMFAGLRGELWLSDWQGVRVLALDGRVRTLRTVRDGPRLEHLDIRADDDAWAVTSDTEWEVMHYDGTRWTTVRRRVDFPGKYDDNKLLGFAVTGEGVWVSTWNGLWRGVGADWQKIAGPPDEHATFADLWVYRGRVIVGASAGPAMRDGDGWRGLGWAEETRLDRSVSDIGLFAAPDLEGPTVTLGAVEGPGCTVTSEAVRGGSVDAVTVDRAGRTWVTTDQGLAVLDVDGRVVAQWSPGSLPGLTGRIVGVTVIGRGPDRLPAARAGRTWDIVGRLKTYKSGAPLADLEIELCSATGRDGRCAGAPFTPFKRAARTGADGSFRFVGVPEGALWILVRPPEGLPDCASPFTVNGHFVAPARDCRAQASAPGVCDLGEITQCLPFEMPPR